MKWKQLLIDLGVLVAIPAIFILGKLLVSPGGDSAALLLVTGNTNTQEYGVKVKSALESLRTINTKDWNALFSDPAFLSLNEFSVEIETVTLGRRNPFTPSPAVRELTAKKSLGR